MLGGGSLNVGTIPSKTIREAVMYLTGMQQRTFYGQDYRLKTKSAIEDLSARAPRRRARARGVRDQLQRNHVDIVDGTARFVDPHTFAVTDGTARAPR